METNVLDCAIAIMSYLNRFLTNIPTCHRLPVRSVALTVFLFLLLPECMVASGEILFQDNFSSGMANWTIVDEGTISAPSAWRVLRGVLQQKSDINGAPNFGGTYAVAGQTNWSDYTVATRMMSGDIDAIGLMFAYQGEDNYYRFAMNSRLATRKLEKLVNGVWTLLAQDSKSYMKRQWYKVEARVLGGAVEIWVDEKLVFQVADASHTSGQVGFVLLGQFQG